jgi:hypothetical protein
LSRWSPCNDKARRTILQGESVDQCPHDDRNLVSQRVDRHRDELLLEAKRDHSMNRRKQAAGCHAQFGHGTLWKQLREGTTDVAKEVHLFVDDPLRNCLAGADAVLEQGAPKFDVRSGEVAIGDRDAHQLFARGASRDSLDG